MQEKRTDPFSLVLGQRIDLWQNPLRALGPHRVGRERGQKKKRRNFYPHEGKGTATGQERNR